MSAKCEGLGIGDVFSDGNCGGFPSFLPKEVGKIKDPFARTMARKIERLPVKRFLFHYSFSPCVLFDEINGALILHRGVCFCFS